MTSEDVQTNLRLPAELKHQLVTAAAENKRSLSAEVAARLDRKPIRYHIQVHTHWLDHPVWHAESDSPFPAITIGDRFNHRGLDCVWDPEPKDGQTYRVKDIGHIFSEHHKHLSHVLQVYLEIVDLPR